MPVGLPLIKNVLTLLAKNILVPLGLTAPASATYAGIQKQIFGSWRPSDLDSQMTPSVLLNEDLNDIMKIVKSFE